jgi:glycosyltransferase involved in cell wall biosynthesis
LPTVCTPLQSLRRYFGDEPLIRFSEFDGASFGERILSWLQEPVQKRRQLAPAAIQRVRAALDWRVISRRALDFVEDRLALRSAGPPR